MSVVVDDQPLFTHRKDVGVRRSKDVLEAPAELIVDETPRRAVEVVGEPVIADGADARR